MQLQDIEKIVLMNIGGDRYSVLSVATDDGKIEDFAILHKCVLMAREEIKLHTSIPSILKKQTITTVASQKAYNLASDFDVPEKIIYITTANSQFPLGQLYLGNILQKKSNITDTGTPDSYMIIGNTSNLIQMELYDTPNMAGETAYVYYKPILANITTNTGYDMIMAKYPNVVIKFATAYGFYYLRKDKTQFDIWFALGNKDLSEINKREIDSDSNYKELPNSYLRAKRIGRTTK